jgi:hypothetical protein
MSNPTDLLHTAVTGDPIEALAAIHELQQVLNNLEQQHVQTLRRHDASWAFIGRQLGLTRQGTRRRYAHWEPTTT